MKKWYSIVMVVVMTVFLSACYGERVEIPPAHVGKVLTPAGFSPDTLPPSKFRLPYCAPWEACDKLVTLEATDKQLDEIVELFMPRDKLILTVQISGTYTVASDNNTTDRIFDRVPSTPMGNYLDTITASRVYATYGRDAVISSLNNELIKYSIEEILENREAISQNIHAAMISKLRETNTPIQITRFNLAKIDPPRVIVEAQQATKEREIAIQRAEADAEVQLVEAERALEVERKQRLVEVEKAEAIAEANRILSEGVTPELIEYRRLEMMENVAKALSTNQNAMVVPMDMSSLADNATFARMLGDQLKK